MKSDKLALIEDKILNLMFLNIYIPAVLIENWLRVTHSQRQKLSVTSVLLFRHILKTTPWLECGFNLLNSSMWPDVLSDVFETLLDTRLFDLPRPPEIYFLSQKKVEPDLS